MAGPNHAMNLHAQPAQGLDMHDADESSSDDGGSDFAERPFTHRALIPPALFSATVGWPLRPTLERGTGTQQMLSTVARDRGVDIASCPGLMQSDRWPQH